MKNLITTSVQVALALALFCLGCQSRAEEIIEQGIYSFGSVANDGSQPNKIAQGSDGWLYGTTYYGGNGNVGTIFKINTNGMGYMILHSFTTNSAYDGAYPTGDIVVSGGSIYGVTSLGGVNNAGTAYKINTDGSDFGLIHSFALHSIADAPTEYPQNLMLANDGNLYGVIFGGSGNFNGCVFKMNTSGAGYEEIHSFGESENQYLIDPQGGLIQGRDGALYGTTVAAGGLNFSDGVGGVFKLNTDISGYAELYDFIDHTPDPNYPTATLLQGSDGALYGTSLYGGTNSIGTIFRIGTNSPGQYTELYSFTNSYIISSAAPNALVQGPDGLLYGTTAGLGNNDLGTIFRINTNGLNFTNLYLFGGVDGGSGYIPASMILGQDGSFYGVTSEGGIPGSGLELGTVFKFSVIEPTISATKLFITFAGNHFTLSWPTNSPAGFTYNSLQVATNLSSSTVWTTLYGQVSNTNYVYYDFFTSPQQKFYRLIH